MNKLSKKGKLLAFIGVGVIVFGILLMINDDGGTFTGLAIPFVFIGILIIMASILFIGNLSKKAFHTNNFIFLFMLLAFNTIALFGAEFSGGAGSDMYFATMLSYVIWGIFYFLQFVLQQGLANFLVPYYGNIFVFLGNRSWCKGWSNVF